MAASGVQIGIAIASFVDNKFYNGKMSKIINSGIDDFLKKHPGIAKGVNSVRDYLKRDKVRWFINGMTAGYFVGNVYEMFANETVLDTVKGAFEKDVPTNVVADANTPAARPRPHNYVNDLPNDVDVNGVENVVDNVVENVVDNVTNITLEPGASYNLDGLVRGFVSSDATESVHLMSGVSDNLIFDRIVNGRAHFLQPNGQGMAWYDLKEVEEYLAKMAETVSKTAGR